MGLDEGLDVADLPNGNLLEIFRRLTNSKVATPKQDWLTRRVDPEC